MHKKDMELRYVIKRGTQLLWLYGAMVVIFFCGIILLVSQMLEFESFGIIVTFMLMIIFAVAGILNKFGCDNEIFKIYDNFIVYTKKYEEEMKYFWEDITYKKERVHFIISRNKHIIKTHYTFFKNENKLFVINDREDRDKLKFINEKLINTGILKEHKTIVDGEEVLEVRPNKSLLIDLFAVIVSSLFLLAFALVGVLFENGDHGFTLAIYIISIPFQMKWYRRELIQYNRKVYVVKDKGFYILTKDEKKFYKFSEIDTVEVESYFARDDIDYVMTIYNNDNEKIIVLTNSNFGFYEFLDMLKDMNKVK